MNRISNSEHRCDKTDIKNSIFSSYDLWNLQNDCKIFLTNLTYGCLNLRQIDFEIDIEMHLLGMGYKVCTSEILNNETVNKQIMSHCDQNVLPYCYEIHYQREVKSFKTNSAVNKKSQIIN